MKSRLSFVSVFSLFFFGLFISSCQKDDLLNPSDGSLSFRESPSFSYSANPVNVGDSVEVSFNADNGADCGHIHIQVSGPDGSGWGNGGKPSTPDSGLATLIFIPDAPGEYLVRAKYTRTGNPNSCPYMSTAWIVAPDTIVVEGEDDGEEEVDSCETSFTGEAISCDSTREVVFTYTSNTSIDYVKIKGGLTNFTGEDAIVTVAGADFDVTQKTPGNSSNRVITLEGGVEACVTVTITITWNSTNEDPVITGDWTATGGLEVEGLSCD